MRQDMFNSLTLLRRRAVILAATLPDDLPPFLQADDLTFRRLPNSNGSVSVTTTCSALMALALTRQIERFYESMGKAGDAREKIKEAFSAVISADWKSSRLKEKNPFTTALVLRAAGILKKYNAFPPGFRPEDVQHKTQTLRDIALDIAGKAPGSFSVQNYPSTPAIGYWFIDAIDNLGIELDDKTWIKITDWVSKTFAKQLSLVSARHDAMMDPVEMGMAACLAARINQIAANPAFKLHDEVVSELPSSLELQHAARILFRYQGDSGIWPKYFPLFHYPDVGANYCFSFELLEVIVHEFAGTGLLEEEPVFQGIQKAVTWCEDNRFEYHFDDKTYRGWNSGGQLTTLSKGIPESWATSVIHMFLCRLRRALSEMIENRTLERYGTRRIHPPKKDSGKWDRLIDSPVWLPGNVNTTVKRLIEEQIIAPVESSGGYVSRQRPLKHRRSALLFGPPGTSKTTLVRAISSRISWPLVELNPSHFLKQGLERIYIRADKIFDDLMNLSGAVVMFDEMDALAQRRVEHLDVTRQFLTTSMLPKFSTLHDHAQVLFFMATNHQHYFDDAIKRPGRFDLLICMGPSLWEEKLNGLRELWVGPGGSDEDIDVVKGKLGSWVGERDKDNLHNLLDLFTFGEMREFFEYLRQGGNLRTAIEGMQEKDFRSKAEDWGKNYITLREKASDEEKEYETIRKEYEQDRVSSRIQ